ncbi:MAG: hypothetical protein ACJ79R_04870 [Anaeromyxobacteraceae bacterium]
MDTSLDKGTPEADALRALRDEVERLARRVACLEAGLVAGSAPATGPLAAPPAPSSAAAVAAAPAPVDEAEVTEEVLAVISAAVAAFLGHKPHIRQIRIAQASWAQQGRVSIQASHALALYAR